MRSADSNSIVFVNGSFSKAMSSSVALPEGVVLKDLSLALNEYPKLISSYFDIDAIVKENVQGAFLYIPQYLKLEKPIHILFLADGDLDREDLSINNVVIAEKASRVVIAEEYRDVVDSDFTHYTSRCEIDKRRVYTNRIKTNVSLAASASICRCRVQTQSDMSGHEYNFTASQAQNSSLELVDIITGGALVKDNLQILFKETGADLVVRELYYPKGKQKFAANLSIDHAVSDCESDVIVKGVADNNALFEFCGRIDVSSDAQRSRARLTNRNLLLSAAAAIDTAPELLIYADDVHCSHGATIGQIDSQMLWYLQSRGISLQQAKQMLIEGFMKNITDSLPDCLQRMGNFVFEKHE